MPSWGFSISSTPAVGSVEAMEPSGVALVSGAGRGFGRAIAEALAAAGFSVHAGARSPATVEAFDDGLPITIGPLDIRDLMGFEPPPQLTVLVNNAGLDTTYLPVEHGSAQEWHDVFETNVFGLVELTRRCLPAIRRNGGGVIVNVTSASLRFPMPFYAADRASKAAVSAFGESLAAEVAGFGIRVIEVAPGPVATDMLAASDRLPEAAAFDGYDQLANEAWEGRRAIEAMITPASIAAGYVVTAILDDSIHGTVACDPLGADLLGVPLRP